MHLENKVVIVTGASSGIGRTIAKQLADMGARLVLTARRAEKLAELRDEITATGAEAVVVAGDITQATTAQAVAQAALDAFGRIDVLVNNAGYGPPAALVDTDEALWDVTLDTCLKSVYLMTRAVLPQMLKQGAGHVVQISSVAGKNGYANRTAYCAAKWGVQGFTEALRAEVGEQGIRAYTINPGPVATPWWATGDDAQPDHVMQRMITAEEVADAVLYVLTQSDRIQIKEVVIETHGSAWRDE